MRLSCYIISFVKLRRVRRVSRRLFVFRFCDHAPRAEDVVSFLPADAIGERAALLRYTTRVQYYLVVQYRTVQVPWYEYGTGTVYRYAVYRYITVQYQVPRYARTVPVSGMPR